MGILIVASDFSGKWNIAKSSNDELDAYIEMYEERFLIELLGKTLFDLFEADLTARVPQTDPYKLIYNSFVDDSLTGQFILFSDGMKDMLLALIYFEYVRDRQIKMPISGPKREQSEVMSETSNTFLIPKYNKGVDTYNAIQWYIIRHKDDWDVFEDFNGVCKEHMSLF